MSLKRKLLQLVGLYNVQNISKVTDSNLQLPTVERMSYRDFLIENATGRVDNWKSKVNNNVITGDLTFIKESIDWWCDKKMMLPRKNTLALDSSSSTMRREIVVHRGFKIINDNGKSNGWYMLHRGVLLKGTKSAIQKEINMAIKKSQE